VESFETQKKYYCVHISSEGMSCTCKKFLIKFGRPRKHIFACLIKQGIIESNTYNSAYEAILQPTTM
jgi:hypothetical protein